MISEFLEDHRIFCYVVCVNDGFYMEPDISVDKVFLDYRKAKQYCNKIKSKYRGAFIEKRLLILE